MKKIEKEFGIISFVAGIISMVLFWCIGASILASAIGITIGIIYIVINKEGKVFAIIGIVMSSIGFLLSLMVVLFLGIAGGNLVDTVTEGFYDDEFYDDGIYNDEFFDNDMFDERFHEYFGYEDDALEHPFSDM